MVRQVGRMIGGWGVFQRLQSIAAVGEKMHADELLMMWSKEYEEAYMKSHDSHHNSLYDIIFIKHLPDLSPLLHAMQMQDACAWEVSRINNLMPTLWCDLTFLNWFMSVRLGQNTRCCADPRCTMAIVHTPHHYCTVGRALLLLISCACFTTSPFVPFPMLCLVHFGYSLANLVAALVPIDAKLLMQALWQKPSRNIDDLTQQ